MRLTDHQIQAIRNAASRIAGSQVRVRVFGSRLDDSAINIQWPIDGVSESPSDFHPNLSWLHYRALMRVIKFKCV